MDTSPLAFPVSTGPGGAFEPGMSLRDWFAGQALTGMLANASVRQNLLTTQDFAAAAYASADAMIRMRSALQQSKPEEENRA